MDNKITKTRLSNYLSYEWIMIIVIVIVAIVAWELIYTMAGVRLSTGQTFKYYYDETVYSSNDVALYDLFKVGQEDGTFSYDVLDVGSESLTSEYNVLSVRLSTQDGDAIITDINVGEEEGAVSRAEEILNSCSIYDLDSLYDDARSYLAGFLKEKDNDPLDYDNLDESLIEANFRERMKKDNRFRKEEQKLRGIEQEKIRIKRLCAEVADYKKFLDNADSSLFYYHTLNEQLGEKRYGIMTENLTDGKLLASNYFRNRTDGSSSGVIIMIFNFKSYQPDLQFETISFVNTVLRNFSDILSA